MLNMAQFLWARNINKITFLIKMAKTSLKFQTRNIVVYCSCLYLLEPVMSYLEANTTENTLSHNLGDTCFLPRLLHIVARKWTRFCPTPMLFLMEENFVQRLTWTETHSCNGKINKIFRAMFLREYLLPMQSFSLSRIFWGETGRDFYALNSVDH
jgi:hypothetical protein